MAKFIKSIFSSSENPKCYEQADEERRDSPPLDGRRQLSISRSGRMRQNNKKRQFLALELYGDNGDINIDVVERPKSMEYHVNTPVCHTAPAIMSSNREYTTKDTGVESETQTVDSLEHSQSHDDTKLKSFSDGAKSPEEEIDNAFEVIDKT